MATTPALTAVKEKIEPTILQRVRLSISKVLRGQQPHRSQSETPMFPKNITNRECLSEKSFVSELQSERRRAERSSRPFVLMLLELPTFFRTSDADGIRQKLLHILSKSTRETDIRGWHRQGSVFGIIFTEIGEFDKDSILHALSNKIRGLLALVISSEQANQASMSFHIFPEASNDRRRGHSSNAATLNGDLERASNSQNALSAKA